MRKISLMTISMFFQMFFKYQIENDREELLESYEEMMELISDTGYVAVDVTDTEVSALGLDEVKNVLDKYHLKVSSYIYFAEFARMDEEGFENRVQNAKNAADRAARLGTDVLMLVPQAQEGIADFEPEEIHAQLIRHWTPVAQYAGEKGIYTVVEDTPDLSLHFCAKEDVKTVLDAVPGLYLVYDSGNMILTGEDPAEYYDYFADRVRHVHIKDMRIASPGEAMADTALDGTKMTGASTGTGMVDLKKVMERIKASDYQGYLTVEFAPDADQDYRKSLKRSREYLEALL